MTQYMYKYLSIAITISLTFSSCINEKKKTILGNEKQSNWDKIAIKTDFQLIEIYSVEDTLTSDTWSFKDSLIEPGRVWHMPTNNKKERVYLEPELKDSIYATVWNMITEPVFTEQSVTCYAGNIKVILTSGNTELCCKYYSVGNWTTVSANTRTLYSLLSSKTIISTQ